MQTKLSSQGQVSVPAPVRKLLHLIPGSVLVWTQEGDRIVVERERRHTTAQVHQALFPDAAPGKRPDSTLVELKQGVRDYIRRRHAGG